MQKESSEIIITVIAGTITLLLLGGFIISFLLLYRRRHHRYLREKQQMQLSYEQELLKARLEIKEQTFKNISQEIHDNIGQVLSLAKLNIATMENSPPETLGRKIQDSKKLVSQAIHDLRNLSHSLSMDYIADLGLARAIEHELSMVKKAGDYETAIEMDGAPYSIDNQKELILYRMIQEILNNIIKHATAQKIIIYLGYRPEKFTLTITDNGKGFDLTPLNDNNSFGLGIRHMHNRAQLIGAGFLISSTLELGTSVTITVPTGTAAT